MNLSHLRQNYAAVDFGISNTDIVAVINGALHTASRPTAGAPSPDQLRELLQLCDTAPDALTLLATTGGRHRLLPSEIDGTPLVPVGELEAISRGGQALAGLIQPETLEKPLLVVSAGSGTAYMAARGRDYAHVIGSGVGGGTMLGLSRRLLGTVDPGEIDALAVQGDPNGVDLALSDVVSGPIGDLPPDTTAVNFGRLAQSVDEASSVDMAAGIVTLVGQVVGTLAVSAAHGQALDRAVFTGHLTDMASMRAAIGRVSHFFGMPLDMPRNAGFATATGALLYAVEFARS
jgi:type II pantothenate kinase